MAAMRMTLAVCAAIALALVSGQVRAQTAPLAGVDAGLLEDIVVGSRILADFGVLDGFGHVSALPGIRPIPTAF